MTCITLSNGCTLDKVERVTRASRHAQSERRGRERDSGGQEASRRREGGGGGEEGGEGECCGVIDSCEEEEEVTNAMNVTPRVESLTLLHMMKE